MPNWSQLSGIVDRLVLMGLSYAVAKGWITSADVAPLAELGVALVGAGYALFVNRQANLAKQAASIPNTTVITTKEIAAATPKQDNIVSSADVKVVPK